MNTREETILVIESAPDAAMQRQLRHALAPYELVEAQGHKRALEVVSHRVVDLVVLRLVEEEQSVDLAYEITQLRRRAGVPIIVLSQEEDAHYAAWVLDAGADDYVSLSVGHAEMAARCRALLRRASLPNQAVTDLPRPPFLSSRDEYLRMYLDQRQVFAGPQHVRLTKTEFDLLAQMMLHAGKILPHNRLLQAVWGPGYGGQANLLRVYILQLRRKVEQDARRPRYIHTKTGIGYGFQLE